jgi:hypothetical protein
MRLNRTVLTLAATTALAGCYVPSAPDEVLYGAVTATNYKAGENFAAFPNVLVNQSIPVIDNTNSSAGISAAAQAEIIAQITDNLVARGYTQFVDEAGSGPDTLRVGAYALFGDVELYYSSYWCSWYYYYYCYPSYGYAGSYNYGTLLIEAGRELYTPGQPPVTGLPPGTSPPQSKLVWTSVSYGVLAGSTQVTTASPGFDKLLASIDQAFAQSPYFTK